jgi:hypothetical protein
VGELYTIRPYLTQCHGTQTQCHKSRRPNLSKGGERRVVQKGRLTSGDEWRVLEALLEARDATVNACIDLL